MTGLLSGFRLLTGGNTLVSLISWLLGGRAPSCLSGAGMASGRICAGICCAGEGAMRSGAGEDMCVVAGAGELCFTGEKEGRWDELGGKEECGLLKL